MSLKRICYKQMPVFLLVSDLGRRLHQPKVIHTYIAPRFGRLTNGQASKLG